MWVWYIYMGVRVNLGNRVKLPSRDLLENVNLLIFQSLEGPKFLNGQTAGNCAKKSQADAQIVIL